MLKAFFKKRTFACRKQIWEYSWVFAILFWAFERAWGRHRAWNWPLEGGIARLLVDVVLLELLGDVAVAVIVLIHTLLQLIWLILEMRQRDERREVCQCSLKQWYKNTVWRVGARPTGKCWPGNTRNNKGLFSFPSIFLKFKLKKAKRL